MDLTPDKRYMNKIQKNVPAKDSVKSDKVSWKVVNLDKKDQSVGMFSGGRCSKSEDKMSTLEDVDTAIKHGDLVSLLSYNSEPSVETLFKYLEKNPS